CLVPVPPAGRGAKEPFHPVVVFVRPGGVSVGGEPSNCPRRIPPDDARGLSRRLLTSCGDEEDQRDSDGPMVPLHTLEGAGRGRNGSRLRRLPAEVRPDIEQFLL